MKKLFLTFFVVFTALSSFATELNNIDIYEYIHKESKDFYLKYGHETQVNTDRSDKYVGMQEEFWAMAPLTFKFYQLTATVKKISKNCVIYVENGRNIDDSILDRFASEFDNNIYPTTKKYFGDELIPGIDNDKKITLLLMDIQDGYNPEKSKGFIAGYYLPKNEYSKDKYEYSNEREMLYIDLYPADITSDFSLSVIAHEFQHMIHWNNDPEEELWLNESMSQLAIKICGFDHPSQIYKYAKNPELSLTLFHPEYMVENYGITYLFNYYLMERFFKDNYKKYTKDLVSSKEKGLDSIKSLLKTNGIDEYIDTIIKDYTLTALLNTEDSKYYFDSSLKDFNIKPLKVNEFTSSYIRDNVMTYGTDYIRYSNDNIQDKTLVFDFNGVNESAWSYFPDDVEYNVYTAKYMSWDKANTLSVEKIRLDSENDATIKLSEFGILYDTVDIIVMNNTKNPSMAYQYKTKLIENKTRDLEENTELLNNVKTLTDKSIENENKEVYLNYIDIIEKLQADIEKINYMNIMFRK